LPWNCGFRATFRLLRDPSLGADALDIFLNGDGLTREQILEQLPYSRERVQTGNASDPDAKRYREPRQLFRTIGLVFDEPLLATRRVSVTGLGIAVQRWRSDLNSRNARVLGRYAAQALAACQLRNPYREAHEYSSNVFAFPFAYIWRAMLALDGRISSTELDRAIFHAMDEGGLAEAIDRIRLFRASGNITSLLGVTVPEGPAKNDRIIPWMAWASFGWTFINDKRASGTEYYTLADNARQIVRDAASYQYRHKDFTSEAEYTKYISACAGLPEDLR
jgi:hypothetical protein